MFFSEVSGKGPNSKHAKRGTNRNAVNGDIEEVWIQIFYYNNINPFCALYCVIEDLNLLKIILCI